METHFLVPSNKASDPQEKASYFTERVKHEPYTTELMDISQRLGCQTTYGRLASAKSDITISARGWMLLLSASRRPVVLK